MWQSHCIFQPAATPVDRPVVKWHFSILLQTNNCPGQAWLWTKEVYQSSLLHFHHCWDGREYIASQQAADVPFKPRTKNSRMLLRLRNVYFIYKVGTLTVRITILPITQYSLWLDICLTSRVGSKLIKKPGLVTVIDWLVLRSCLTPLPPNPSLYTK